MKKSPHLTPGEFELIQILWQTGEASVRDVWQKVDPGRGLAYTTVMTVLEKMHKKGILSQRKKGKAYLYTSALTREEALKGVLDHVCSAYFSGVQSDLVAFVNKRLASAAETASGPATVEGQRTGER
jgi:predicted transcriptional regulator